MNRERLRIFLAGTLIAAFCSNNPGWFLLDREQIHSGELWRFYTGHFVQFSAEHFLSNVIVLALLLSLMPQLSRGESVWLGAVTPALIGTGLYFARPELAAYGGLSGWLSGIFIFIAMKYSLERHWSRYLFLLSIGLFVAKLAFEFSFQAPLFGNLPAGVVVETTAHALGGVVGAGGVMVERLLARTGHGGSPGSSYSSMGKGQVLAKTCHFPETVRSAFRAVSFAGGGRAAATGFGFGSSGSG